MNGLTKEDSWLIGFVTASLMNQAAGAADVRRWAENILTVSGGDAPLYLVDISVDWTGGAGDLVKIIGFPTGWPKRIGSRNALFGIAVLRGEALFDAPLSEKQALTALDSNPGVMRFYREVFPWVEFAK